MVSVVRIPSTKRDSYSIDEECPMWVNDLPKKMSTMTKHLFILDIEIDVSKTASEISINEHRSSGGHCLE